MRTGLEHLRPIARARSSEHGHAVLVLGHAVVCQLGIDVGINVVRVHTAVALIEAASGRGSAHNGSRHGSSITVRIVNAAGPRKLALVVGELIHAIRRRGGDEAERVNHSVGRHASHAVHVVNITFAAHSLLRGGVLLDVRLRVREMAGTGRVTPADGALLEVTLQNVTARKRIAA